MFVISWNNGGISSIYDFPGKALLAHKKALTADNVTHASVTQSTKLSRCEKDKKDLKPIKICKAIP